MKDEREIHLQGISLSKGIALGIPYFLPVIQEDDVPEFSIAKGDIDNEIARYRNALLFSRKDLETLQDHLILEGSSEAVTIIDTHIQMLEDPIITSQVEEKIRESNQNTESVFTSIITEYKRRFSKNTDPIFRQRFADVTDVTQRVLGHLIPERKTNMVHIPENSIIFSQEISPSDTAAAQVDYVMGIVTEVGGSTSHAALIAKAKGIPFVTGIEISKIQEYQNCFIIVDGFKGKLIINPRPETLAEYKKIIKKLITQEKRLEKESKLCAKTIDGEKVHVLANVGSAADLDMLMKYGAGGIGLVRTEYFLLQNRNFLLSEKLQYSMYKRCIEKAAGLPVVIRIFDLGGDKFPDLVYYKEKEVNPFLGCRGIRFLLKNQEILKIQFRAILRAAVHGDVQILLPLISDVREVLETKKILENVKKEMIAEEVEIREDIPIGCMMEVPSAVLTCDILAKECDFFSIGTNDLVQYTLAVDRANPAVHNLHDPFHPSMLRMIQMLVHESKVHNKKLSVCGEVAYKPLFIPLLLGLGILHFSCPPRYISLVKKIVRKCSLQETSQDAKEALQLSTSQQIYEFIRKKYGKVFPEEF